MNICLLLLVTFQHDCPFILLTIDKDLPLQSLDLTGYGNITDVGIGHISKMDK
jgi:hypothetical protein